MILQLLFPTSPFSPPLLANFNHTFYASAVPKALSCVYLMATHASYLSGLDSMIDFLRVKKRAGSGKIHVEHGTWWGKRHLSNQPNQLSQLAHLWVRADRSTSQRVCSFMLPFLCTWCYLCLDPMTPSASLGCCQTPHYPLRPPVTSYSKII